VVLAASRHAANPNDKILPLPGGMAEAMAPLLFQPDQLSGRLIFWADTLASLERLGMGIGISTLSALLVGLLLGALPPVRATFGPLVTAVAVIPPIALLPILFIAFGLGETAKVALIVIGIAPLMIRDVAAHIAALPREQIVKAQTLGASSWQLMLRVALPQAMPRLIQAVRLSLGPAWVFLISAEAIASDIGLGYRIFLVRRYLSMDIILPYVAWIALLAVAMDFILTLASRRLFPWAHGASH
jgi:NitT/TauT family transport system permease protein